jgi:pyrimidine-nucleoside phosphorylase
MATLASEFIRRKRSGLAHSPEEIQRWIEDYLNDEVRDYQMAAWLMAVYFKGMNAAEANALTSAMLNSGERLKFTETVGLKVDKHSTGGVGDKTSLVLAPIVASCGVPVPMMSGRGLGHTGGTLDKLESIPGFRVRLSGDEMTSLLNKEHLFFIGQSDRICPADKRLYALRDVTGTVESIPLICASIMSKKIAEGANAVVFDVKFGSGAFMKTFAQARELGEALVQVSKEAGLGASAFITSVHEPLGRWVGNAVEVQECIQILKQQNCEHYQDTQKLSLDLAAEMLCLANATLTFEEALTKANAALTSGRAWETFERVCRSQGGDLSALQVAKQETLVFSQQEGFVSRFDSEGIGYAGILLGAGRMRTEDPIDSSAGIEVLVKLGSPVKKGQPVFRLLSSKQDRSAAAASRLQTCFEISENLQPVAPLVAEILRQRN